MEEVKVGNDDDKWSTSIARRSPVYAPYSYNKLQMLTIHHRLTAIWLNHMTVTKGIAHLQGVVQSALAPGSQDGKQSWP